MSENKIKELIVYVAQQCSEDENFGVTKLNKILFFADFLYYLQHKESITGCDYIHEKRGPVPKGIEELREKMEKKDIATAYVKSGPYIRHKVVALRDARISDIAPEKIAFLTKVIDHFCGDQSRTATWMSEFSHEFIGWDVTKIYETIPYQTIYLKNKTQQILTEQELQYGKELAQRCAREITQEYATATP